jgi:hypothetical protein
MKITIAINMDNAAFDNHQSHEVARILRDLAGDMEYNTIRSFDGLEIKDYNGNKCGTVKLSGKVA